MQVGSQTAVLTLNAQLGPKKAAAKTANTQA